MVFDPDLGWINAYATKVAAVWAKGHEIPGLNPFLWKLDDHGNLICALAHGDRSHPQGWEMDHFPIPKILGGSDDLGNLRPLHWRANAGIGGAFSGFGSLSP